MSQTRKDYEHCILDPEEPQGFLHSICGRHISMEFHFTNVRHWMNNRLEYQGRLIGCRQCLAIIKEAIEMEEE